MHYLHLGSQQTRVATVQLINELSATDTVGVITPKESVLAEQHCDFVEGYWTRESTFHISVTNWGGEPTVLTKGSVMGHIELVEVVKKEEPIWEDEQFTETAKVCSVQVTSEWEQELEARLNIGKDCSPNERKALVQLINGKQGVFALSDEELGQTDLVEHSIQMSDLTPVRTPPRRLPYALRSELENELQKLLNTGCRVCHAHIATHKFKDDFIIAICPKVYYTCIN